MIRSLAAEAIGCALLAVAALGAAQVATASGYPVMPAVAAAAGLMLIVTITLMAPVSGGHVNPAITLLFFARGEISAPRAGLYIVAQITGAMVGSLVVAWVAAPGGVATVPLAVPPGWGLGEALATGGFVFVVAGALAHQPQASAYLAGAFGAVMVLATASGGMANPAVMAARAITLGPGGLAPGVAVTLLGWQLGGTLLALGPALWLFGGRKPAAQVR